MFDENKELQSFDDDNVYYISNYSPKDDAELLEQMEVTRKYRNLQHLRRMQSNNFIGRAAIRASESWFNKKSA
jgi:hypothetical protein